MQKSTEVKTKFYVTSTLINKEKEIDPREAHIEENGNASAYTENLHVTFFKDKVYIAIGKGFSQDASLYCDRREFEACLKFLQFQRLDSSDSFTQEQLGITESEY